MHLHRHLPFALIVAGLAAQAPVDLPLLSELGPGLAGARTLTLCADGSVWRGDERLDAAALAPAVLPKNELVLAVDRSAKCALVAAVLAAAQANGATKVLFQARLPDGKVGCFTLALALPSVKNPETTIDVRLHHERDGVPPASVVPVLARMVNGMAEMVPTFVVGIVAPADEPFERVLRVLAASAAAGANGAVLRCAGPDELPERVGAGLGALAGQLGGKAKAGRHGGELAIDLGTSPIVRVSARAPTPTTPILQGRSVGFLVEPTEAATASLGGGAGGRYGGRPGRGGAKAQAAQLAVNNALGWLRAQQAPEGGIRGQGGKLDIEATALALLAVLGNGVADAGSDELLRSGLGYLLDQQRADGGFFEPGLGSIRRHALCTYAMAEAAGLVRQGALMRGSVADALGWLAAQRQPDGGWSEGNPGAPSECSSTTLCLMAIASGEFFKLQGPARTEEVGAWYDLVAEPTGAHRRSPTTPAANAPDATATAAALFARFFAGQSPAASATMKPAADLLLAHADPADPWCCYWTTYALFQTGGRPWQEWSKKFERAVLQGQIAEGGDAGSWPATAGLSAAMTTALRTLTLEAFHRYSRLVR